jgi:endonuclease/exonuclease/phosphatase family metal-dependent hydrolase
MGHGSNLARPLRLGSVRLISVNAWGGAMFDSLGPWLPTVGADVVCLQEVTRTPGLAGWTRFEDAERALPQRANLLADVQQLLPGHRGVFVASDAGPVYDEAGSRHRQDFGVATFVAEQLTVVGIESAFVHGEFIDHDEWVTEDRPRAALATRFVDHDRGRGVTVVQLHGLRDPAGKHDTPARRSQAERLAALVERSRGVGDLSVVCGDLNLLPESETFGVLARLGLVELVGLADTRTSRYPKPVRHASYLLVSDPGSVARFEILAEPEVSDHRALLLETCR